ncbi:MAG: aminotransferase class V-fold PLP-dependent enzyme, partial [Bacilli bacterium]
MIYLDNAATTYPKPACVYEAVNKGMLHYSFNSGRGSYKAATNTFKMIEETRQKIGSLIKVSSRSVIFTSSATESLNNIIYGLNLVKSDTVFVSPFEHNAVIRTLKNVGCSIVVMPFDRKTWKLDYEKLNDLYVLKHPKATIISHISNVTGFELPYEQIFKLSHQYKSINVLDCAQSFGIYSVSPVDADFIVFAGHKSLYAMFGIAGYININQMPLAIYKAGGTGSDSLNEEMPADFPYRYEAGSMNSVGIYSLNISLSYLSTKKFDIMENSLTKYLIDKLSEVDKVLIYLPESTMSRGIVSFNIQGYSADEVGTILSEDYDICVRTGYHCAPLIHDFIGSKPYHGTVRVSLGIFNTKEEIDFLINAI